MEEVNKITLTKDKFGDDLWNFVSQRLQILTQAGEICVVYDDDKDTIVIQHEHRDTWSEAWGCSRHVWLNAEEQEVIENYRLEKEEGKNSGN